ncbi:Uma2 family endonuclease [Flavisolibacter sp. BT320]|nr:Uma2 family endonuclease [Flavisolibacter longurius]
MIQTPPRTIMEVFESLPEGTLAEVINNQLIMSPAPTPKHQLLVKKISFELEKHVKANILGEVLFAPVDVQLNDTNIFQPDIVFIQKSRMGIIQDKIKGVPDLVVEVLSPGSEKLDTKNKKEAYEKSGVREYWIVNPETKEVTGYQLKENKYMEIPSETGTLTSILLGTTIRF